MHTTFDRLVRFANKCGQIFYGEAPTLAFDPSILIGEEVPVFEGGEPWNPGFKLSGNTQTIDKILSPIPETPIYHCVGLNYRHHIEESKNPMPKHPALFNKPSDALAGPLDDISIQKEARGLDYEGELSIVIGKEVKGLAEDENPLDYVLGYTVGNDFTSRYWQDPKLSSYQAGYAKSFDGFGPIGPFIASTRVIPDPGRLQLTVRVNGEQRQQANTDDLVFDVKSIIRFLARGRTIRVGTIIMTGTPSGVGAFLTPPIFLKHGDIVEVEIEKIGIIKNRVIFQS